MGLTIITNNVPRDIVDASELTPREREAFDYLDWQKIDNGEDGASFFRYRGTVYSLGDFSADWGITRGTGLPDDLKGWDGFMSDSFFSGMVVRFVDHYERIIVGRFYS